jgi:NTP pyrophosphatase (non-canonical NTP hydrolase)
LNCGKITTIKSSVKREFVEGNNMADIKVSDMMKMQMELFEKHKDTWSPIEAQYGRNSILWMMEEVGEVIALIKKKGEAEIVSEPSIRSLFVEEISDVLMYYIDTLLRYGISADEISDAYIKKHFKNMGRNYDKEYENKFE